MSLQISVLSDTITPDLKSRLAKLNNLTPASHSIGTALVSLAKRAFAEPSLRPSPWPNKKDGSVSTLRKTGLLNRSPRILYAAGGSVVIGSDRPYAAIHQLGGTTPAHVIRAIRAKSPYFQTGGRPVYAKRVSHPGSRIPSRPFFPFDPSGHPTDQADQAIHRVLSAKIHRIVFDDGCKEDDLDTKPLPKIGERVATTDKVVESDTMASLPV